MTREPESPAAVLERWEAHGALWRVLALTEQLAVVELCTCHGAPVEQLRSSDPDLLRFLTLRSGLVSPGDLETPAQ
jgi:hypothetical protein